MYHISQFLMQKIVPLAQQEVQFYMIQLYLIKSQENYANLFSVRYKLTVSVPKYSRLPGGKRDSGSVWK